FRALLLGFLAKQKNDSACAASIVRVTSFNEVVWTDVSYTIVSASIWTNVEQSMGIICACLSTLRPLLTRMFPAVTSSSFKRENTSSGPTKNNDQNADDCDPILLAGMQSSLNNVEVKSPMPRLQWPKRDQGGRTEGNFRIQEDQAEATIPPGGGWIRTNVSRGSDPDLEGLGDDHPTAIIKSQSIVQNSTKGGRLAGLGELNQAS
ncbi:MAG: hypothetical protein Q9224_003912, partial [Gallowayella concinna]